MPDSPGHPARFDADYVAQRSRLTTFFRFLLVIPHAIVLGLWGFVASFAAVGAWFALVFTGRYPQSLYDFVGGYLRYMTYVYGYAFLLTDPYPPFSGRADVDYPVRLVLGAPQGSYSRLKAGFRLLLAIPVAIILYAMQIVAQVGAFLAWFAIVALGRQPESLQKMIRLGVSYQQRAYAYLFLVDEDWPPFADEGLLLEERPPAPTLPPDSSPAA